MAIIAFPYTVTNVATALPLSNVTIWASSDIGGQDVVATGLTNASGIATLSVADASDLYLWHSKAAFIFTNPNYCAAVSVAGAATTGAAIVAEVPDAVVLGTTCRDLIHDALDEINANSDPEVPEDIQKAFHRLNNMIDRWKIERRFIPQSNPATYTLTALATSHTLGPSGTLFGECPTRITRANIVISDARFPLDIIERGDDWAEVTNPIIGASVPRAIYCDYAYPDATIYLWPYPAIAYTLELYTWQQLSKFKTLDEPVILAPGYYDALMYSLAERLFNVFAVPGELRAGIASNAAQARRALSNHNTKAPIINTIDAGIPNTESL
jgi:hypothetical protein